MCLPLCKYDRFGNRGEAAVGSVEALGCLRKPALAEGVGHGGGLSCHFDGLVISLLGPTIRSPAQETANHLPGDSKPPTVKC